MSTMTTITISALDTVAQELRSRRDNEPWSVADLVSRIAEAARDNDKSEEAQEALRESGLIPAHILESTDFDARHECDEIDCCECMGDACRCETCRGPARTFDVVVRYRFTDVRARTNGDTNESFLERSFSDGPPSYLTLDDDWENDDGESTPCSSSAEIEVIEVD